MNGEHQKGHLLSIQGGLFGVRFPGLIHRTISFAV